LQPSDGHPTIRTMFFALMICSDESCPEELEAWGTLEELETSACECGCALQVISVSEVEFDELAPVIAIARRPIGVPLAA
jgi:hypothetical protein